MIDGQTSQVFLVTAGGRVWRLPGPQDAGKSQLNLCKFAGPPNKGALVASLKSPLEIPRGIALPGESGRHGAVSRALPPGGTPCGVRNGPVAGVWPPMLLPNAPSHGCASYVFLLDVCSLFEDVDGENSHEKAAWCTRTGDNLIGAPLGGCAMGSHRVEGGHFLSTLPGCLKPDAPEEWNCFCNHVF